MAVLPRVLIGFQASSRFDWKAVTSFSQHRPIKPSRFQGALPRLVLSSLQRPITRRNREKGSVSGLQWPSVDCLSRG